MASHVSFSMLMMKTTPFHWLLTAFLAVSATSSAMAMMPLQPAGLAVDFESSNKNATDVATMRLVFKNLAQSHYDAAWKLLNQLEGELAGSSSGDARLQSLYPLPDLSRAMLLARPEAQGGGVALPRNAWKAITLVRNVYVRAEGVTEANTFLGDDDIALSVDMIKQLVENELVAQTQAQNTAEAYEKLMEVLSPSHEAYATAKNHLAELEFAQMCTTAQGCHAYLRDYPHSPLIEQAKQKALALDFKEAQVKNTIKGLKKFIATYELLDTGDYVAKAKQALKQLEEQQLLVADVTLQQLDSYAATTRRDVGNRVFTIYDNLINLPTHSYRFMSLKLGFNGATGRVDEVVKDAKGGSFCNYFVFNSQGLLVEEYNGRTKVLTRYSYGYDSKHGFYPLTKEVAGKKYNYTCSYDPTTWHLKVVRCSDGASVSYAYDTQGRLESRTELTSRGATAKISTYKSGKIRTEKSQRVQLKFLRYDGAWATEIQAQNGKTLSKWGYSYEVDERGRWTTAQVTLNGKPRLTITRSYR